MNFRLSFSKSLCLQAAKNMKQLITLIMILFTLMGCSLDTEDTVVVVIAENEAAYDCTDFFSTGDYREFCTIDTESVNILDSTIEDDGTVCNYVIPSLNNDVGTSVSFTSLPTTAQATVAFRDRKMVSDSAAVVDPKKFHTVILVGDYEAFVSETRNANYAKRITVQYKNVLVTTGAIYFTAWFPVIPPCNYDTFELTILMTAVLEHMEK
jgi:hypothetical protein